MWCRVQPGPMDGRRDFDGWVTLRVQFDDEEGAYFVVLGLGPGMDVIGPASLQARVQAAVAATVERVHTPESPAADPIALTRGRGKSAVALPNDATPLPR